MLKIILDLGYIKLSKLLKQRKESLDRMTRLSSKLNFVENKTRL